MKHLKLLGLTAIAALGLMAFVGAGTASATTLCTTTDTPGCTMVYTQGTTIDLSVKAGTSTRLTSGGSTISTCTGGTLKGKTENTSETWIKVELEVVNWTGCDQPTFTVANGTLDIMWIEGTHNAVVRGTNTQWTTIVFGVSCTYGYGTGTELGTLTGGEAPVLKIETTVTKTAGGFLCPATAGWDAEYVVTEPHALFVVG